MTAAFTASATIVQWKMLFLSVALVASRGQRQARLIEQELLQLDNHIAYREFSISAGAIIRGIPRDKRQVAIAAAWALWFVPNLLYTPRGTSNGLRVPNSIDRRGCTWRDRWAIGVN